MSCGDWSAEWQQRENENALRENRAPAVLIPLYQPPTEQVITTARYRELLAAETDLAQARTELAAIKERTCETCKWKFVWLAHNNAPGCYRHGLALPPDCLGCAAHERRAQSAEVKDA